MNYSIYPYYAFSEQEPINFYFEKEHFSELQIICISFGNELFYGSLDRLKNNVLDFPFTTSRFYRDTDLKKIPEFWEKHSSFIENNNRGYGYWLWKSFLTLYTLREMNDNDILFYMDAGCSLNKNGISRFNDYIKKVKECQSGIVSFRMHHKQKTYTKMDVLDLFDSSNGDKGQIQATCYFIRKCDKTMKIVQEWYDMCCNYHLLDDSPSIIPNDGSFIDHRHDQSIWSLIRYKYSAELYEDETYPSHPDYPIFASRLR